MAIQYLVSGTTFVYPINAAPAITKIECIGGGQAGTTGVASGNGGAGGAGGAYSASTGVVTAIGSSVTYAIGAGGVTTAASGGNTTWAATVIVAPGGGSATTAVGGTKNTGGTGGTITAKGGGGGGGAGGANGAGKAGGTDAGFRSGGGGGASDNGSVGANATSATAGGAGGAAQDATAGGTGGSAAAGGSGSHGSGGGGGGGTTTTTPFSGGLGGAGIWWNSATPNGPGGGGGGGGGTSSTSTGATGGAGGTGGLFGGGGGGGGGTSATAAHPGVFGSGASGIIVVTYDTLHDRVHPRPRTPALNLAHPSVAANNRLVQLYVASNPIISDQRELVSNALVTVTTPGAYSFVTDSNTNGYVIFINETATGSDSLSIPFANRWRTATTPAYTALIRVKIMSIGNSSAASIALNSGGDGAYLRQNGTGIYDSMFGFLQGQSLPGVTPHFGSWETFVLRFVSGTSIESWSFSDDGIKYAADGASAGASAGSMNFTSCTQTILDTQGHKLTCYLDFFMTFARFVSDAEIAWMLRSL